MKTFLNEIRNIIMFGILYRWVKTGENVHCQTSTTFWAPHRHIVLGSDVGIGYRCLFSADVEIGSKVLIASNVAFLNSDDHRYDIIGKAMFDSGRGDKYKIVVEDDVWIGHGVIILTPVIIGRGSIVAAGSVVTKNIPPYTIVAGVPAKEIRKRFSVESILLHEAMLYPENKRFTRARLENNEI